MDKGDAAAHSGDLWLSKAWDPQKATYRWSWTCRSHFPLTVPQPALPKEKGWCPALPALEAVVGQAFSRSSFNLPLGTGPSPTPDWDGCGSG